MISLTDCVQFVERDMDLTMCLPPEDIAIIGTHPAVVACAEVVLTHPELVPDLGEVTQKILELGEQYSYAVVVMSMLTAMGIIAANIMRLAEAGNGVSPVS
jgi:hypothetical protein